jgi:uncharacterized membrane protein
MTLAPLLAASPAIQMHAFAALAAFAIGIVQLTVPKGTFAHRTVGWLWVVLMLAVSVSAFWIHSIRLWGPWSPIHLLAIFTLIMVPVGLLHALRDRVVPHKWTMMSVFFGGLMIAGIFTFVPGRIMHAVAFGQ